MASSAPPSPAADESHRAAGTLDLRWMVFDVAVVVSFVVLGRDTHNEVLDIAGVVRTGFPFLIAVPIVWLLRPVRRRPAAVLTGFTVGLVTAALGMLLRRTIFDQGLSGAFPFVAAGYLTALMTLGRVVMRFVNSRR